jgi:hypothetical protein
MVMTLSETSADTGAAYRTTAATGQYFEYVKTTIHQQAAQRSRSPARRKPARLLRMQEA